MARRSSINTLVRQLSNSSTTWTLEVRHSGLNKYRKIKGKNKYEVEEKGRLQSLAWDQQWERKCEVERKRALREENLYNKEQKKAYALEQTKKAENDFEFMQNLIKNKYKSQYGRIWSSLLDKRKFTLSKPVMRKLEDHPSVIDKSSYRYRPIIKFSDKVFKSKKLKKIQEKENLYKKDILNRDNKISEIDLKNEKTTTDYEREVKEWDVQKNSFLMNQEKFNSEIQSQKESYLNNDETSVENYIGMILDKSKYPDYFPQNYELEYNSVNGLLVIDYEMPSIDVIPKLKAVKYIATRDELKESFLSDTKIKSVYDNVLYQIVLRTIDEILSLDKIDVIKTISLNGYVDTIDRTTGKAISPCILSINTSKEVFKEINLELVDPKACFKSLKGISASKLHAISPVAPIISIDRTDSRFTESYDVADDLDETDNLAAMDWQDFEHLIRELFAKEFSSNGGEVKVTQASRDGGVDAIAFDPDPIRGGKIVIQAKRYTNTVGVSAVRDLYGTVMNEGATKGILVTTSDYGPDAYSFANGKPLTLLNGGNLLNLLEKFGHKAKIDIKEAKILLKEEK